MLNILVLLGTENFLNDQVENVSHTELIPFELPESYRIPSILLFLKSYIGSLLFRSLKSIN